MYQLSIHWLHLYISFLWDFGRTGVFHICLHNLYVKNDPLKLSVVLNLFFCSWRPVQGNLILFPCNYGFHLSPESYLMPFVVYVHICTQIAWRGDCSILRDSIISIFLCLKWSENVFAEFQQNVSIKADCPCDGQGEAVVTYIWLYSLIEHNIRQFL